MMKHAKLLFVVVFVLHLNACAGRLKKMIYERDMSEHCRRRVIPSVFLGRKVVEANAKILQFSRLELPYSCLITVRSESGSNMVMMIQVMSKEATSACAANEQLVVYEMGETFGGYWGPLPESALKREPLPPQVYTLKTTRAPTVITYSSDSEEDKTEEEEEVSTSTPALSSKSTSSQSRGEYIEVVVPLVNFSAHFDRADGGTAADDVDVVLDFEDDLTPVPGVEYTSEIIPLVQFNMVEQPEARRDGDTGQGEPRYNLEVGLNHFTPDFRLTLPSLKYTSKKRHSKQRYQPTRRLNFKKHKTLFQSIKQNRRVMPTTTKYDFPTTKKSTQTQDSWKIVEDLLKKLSKTMENSTETTISMKEATIFEENGNMDHSESVYLSPNLSQYGNIKNGGGKDIISKDAVLSSGWYPVILTTADASSGQQEIKLATKILEDVIVNLNGLANDTTYNKIQSTTESMKEYKTEEGAIAEHSLVPSESTSSLIFDTSHSSKNHINEEEYIIGKNSTNNINEKEAVIRKKTETLTVDAFSSEAMGMSNLENINSTRPSISPMTTGSMVGRESWENLVQAAPEMAVLLNKTVDTIRHPQNGSDVEVTEATRRNVLEKRKKRNIHSIAIENGRPHMLTSKEALTTTTKSGYNIGDMQEFAQLAELQDDEMQGRVALRYLRQYLGPPLFNLCQVTDPTKSHVFLFNSSRIVLSLTNFTIERMVIILTAARALRSSEMRCPQARLECQVAGARVCMDSMVACDGVPNCGSYDIYDEDRLLCGHAVISQRNVYLAAFTSLAVLLTLMYCVHYWLKRCVPKVTDAFFVYSDGVENILYLDTIMRSPNDLEEPKMAYQSHMFGDDTYDEGLYHQHKSLYQRFLHIFCACCFRIVRKKPNEKSSSTPNLSGQTMSKRMYSFTELEIRKIVASSTKDTGVQTGESLLMNVKTQDKLALPPSPPALRPAATSYDFSVDVELAKKDSLLTLEEPLPEQYKDELSLLKFFKESRSDVMAGKQSSSQRKPYQHTDASVESSEQEVEITTYERLRSEPGPSRLVRNTERERINAGIEKITTEKLKVSIDKEKTSPQGSSNKHLRFDETPITIPSADDNNDDRVTDNHGRTGRHLAPIQEADEPGSSKDHRHFWRTKGKRNKKGQVKLR